MDRKRSCTPATLGLFLAALLVISLALPTWAAPTRLAPAQGADANQANKMDSAPDGPRMLPPARIQFSADTYYVDETAGTAVITVTLRDPVAYTVTVDYLTGDGTATAGQDYTIVTGTLLFLTNTTVATFTVPILDDSIEEPFETVILTLTNPVNGNIGGPNPVPLIIMDDEPPVVEFMSSEYTVDEGAGAATIEVVLGNPHILTVTVDYATYDGTATAGADYGTTTGTLSFAPGITLGTFAVPIVDDTLDEPDESVILSLTNPVNAAIGPTNPATLWILDNDGAPVVDFSLAAYFVGEPAGNAIILVNLSNAYTSTVTVDYSTIDGTATAGADYTAVNGTLVFTPGLTFQIFTIPILDDTLIEGNETVILSLTNPSNAVIGPNNPATLYIVDDDQFAAPTVEFSALTYSVGEAAGSALVTVTLSYPYTQTATVDYTTIDGTAMDGSDYTGVNGTIVFTPGVTTQTFSVPILDDTLIEGDETVILSLTNPSNATIGRNNPATLTIVDDDIFITPLVEFSAANYSAGEASGSALISVVLSEAYTDTVTVDYSTIDGTATAGSDYTAVNGTLTFTPGVTLQTFSVPILDDTVDEVDETVILSLTNPSNAVIGQENPATLTILDDDGIPTVYFSAAAYNVSEAGGQAVITVYLSNAYSLTSTVDYATTDGTATAGADYVAASGTLTFTPGALSLTFTVTILDDANPEPNETVLLDLSNPVNATLGAPNAAVLTIIDQDANMFKVYLPIILKNG